MTTVEVKGHLGPDEVAAVTALVTAASDLDGHAALGDPMASDLARGDGHGFAAVEARDRPGGRLLGYAQLRRQRAGWGAEFVVAPSARDRTAEVAGDLLAAALAEVARAGGGRVDLWVAKASAESDDVATAAGLAPDRDLLQMRRPLPVTGQRVDVAIRPFRPGQDEAAWLEVNNRAFAGHPEQGGWTLDVLLEREAEPWFDPAGFLLHEREGRLAASCWTKTHASLRPVLGEIYVIAVDPDFQGLGLGRQLTLAGLEHLAAEGIGVGMLYVDAANDAAVALYRSIGFAVDHVDRAYTGQVTARA